MCCFFNVLKVIHMWLLLMFQANKNGLISKRHPRQQHSFNVGIQEWSVLFSPILWACDRGRTNVDVWRPLCYLGMTVIHLHTISKEDISRRDPPPGFLINVHRSRRKGTREVVPSETRRVLKSKPLLSFSLPSMWFVCGSALVFKHAVTIRRPWELRTKNFCDVPPLLRTTLK